MAQIFTLLIIFSLFLVVTNGKVDCAKDADCPKSMCVHPMVAICTNYFCECGYGKSRRDLKIRRFGL
ncbi:hypothetical protein P8452_52205 [Trifolium repens]|nr:hypothetical protein P8452_52205 [Trifolium repens]